MFRKCFQPKLAMKIQYIFICFIYTLSVLPLCCYSSVLNRQPSVQIYTFYTSVCEMAEYRGIIRLSQVSKFNI